MPIYEPEAHSTLCRNTHEREVHTQNMKMPFLQFLHIDVCSGIYMGNHIFEQKLT